MSRDKVSYVELKEKNLIREFPYKNKFVSITYGYSGYNGGIFLATADNMGIHDILTMNIPGKRFEDNEMCVDINLGEEVIKFIKYYDLGEDTGKKVTLRGYEYPVFKFNTEVLKKIARRVS